jgi:hypothetical protein
VTEIVHLRAIRPARVLDRLPMEDLTAHVRDFRAVVRGAGVEPIRDGVRLVLALDAHAVARAADLVRGTADALPFWTFRLLADPPACWLEVSGAGRAGEMARAVFEELAAG